MACVFIKNVNIQGEEFVYIKTWMKATCILNHPVYFNISNVT